MNLRHVLALLTMSVVIVPYTAAQETLPPDQTVAFKIRKTAGDPESPVVWTITAEIRAVARIGEEYQWEVVGVEVLKHGVTPEYDESWYDALPFVDTPDGYWWVTYDGNQSDFRQPPPLLGLALNDDPAGADMYYEVIGEMPGIDKETGSLSFILQRAGEAEPEEDEKDEPTDVPDGVRDPLHTAE